MLAKRIAATLVVTSLTVLAIPGDRVRWAALVVAFLIIWLDRRRLTGWILLAAALFTVSVMWGMRLWGLYDPTATGILSIVMMSAFLGAIAELIIDREE